MHHRTSASISGENCAKYSQSNISTSFHEIVPCSISGTNHGALISSIWTLSSRIWTRSLYIRLLTVASVARTHIFLYHHSTTASAPGTVTQRICFPTNISCCNHLRAWTLAVLHARITTSAQRAKSFSTHLFVSSLISVDSLDPYGALSRSISSIISIIGNSFLNSSITTFPPIKNQKIKQSLYFYGKIFSRIIKKRVTHKSMHVRLLVCIFARRIFLGIIFSTGIQETLYCSHNRRFITLKSDMRVHSYTSLHFPLSYLSQSWSTVMIFSQKSLYIFPQGEIVVLFHFVDSRE